MARAAAGDPTARFVVDSWLIFGFEVLAIGVALVVAARRPGQAQALVWAVLGIEVSRGIVTDTLFITWGRPATGYVVWIVIHSTVIITGLLALRSHQGIGSTHRRKA